MNNFLYYLNYKIGLWDYLIVGIFVTVSVSYVQIGYSGVMVCISWVLFLFYQFIRTYNEFAKISKCVWDVIELIKQNKLMHDGVNYFTLVGDIKCDGTARPEYRLVGMTSLSTDEKSYITNVWTGNNASWTLLNSVEKELLNSVCMTKYKHTPNGDL